MNEIQDGGIGIALQRRLGMRVSPAPALSPEVGATLDLGPQPELLLHLGWRRFVVGGTVAAVAAQNSYVQLANPANSGMLVVIETIVLSTLTAQFIRINTVTGNLGGSANTNHSKLDTRQDAPLSATTVVQSTSAAIGLNPKSYSSVVPANIPLVVPVTPWILSPGQFLTISVDTQNIALDAYTVSFRERRQVTPAELVP